MIRSYKETMFTNFRSIYCGIKNTCTLDTFVFLVRKGTLERMPCPRRKGIQIDHENDDMTMVFWGGVWNLNGGAKSFLAGYILCCLRQQIMYRFWCASHNTWHQP